MGMDRGENGASVGDVDGDEVRGQYKSVAFNLAETL